MAKTAAPPRNITGHQAASLIKPDVELSEDTKPPAEDTNTEPDPNTATVAIEFRGVTVTVPKRRGRWPIDALLCFQDSKPLIALQYLLGPDQWAKVRKLCPFGDDIDEFSNTAGEVIGAECVA